MHLFMYIFTSAEILHCVKLLIFMYHVIVNFTIRDSEIYIWKFNSFLKHEL